MRELCQINQFDFLPVHLEFNFWFYIFDTTVGSQLIALQLIALFWLCDKLGCAISWDMLMLCDKLGCAISWDVLSLCDKLGCAISLSKLTMHFTFFHFQRQLSVNTVLLSKVLIFCEFVRQGKTSYWLKKSCVAWFKVRLKNSMTIPFTQLIALFSEKITHPTYRTPQLTALFCKFLKHF